MTSQIANSNRWTNVFYKKGFTLIELLVVVAILGILAAILVPVGLKSYKAAQSVGCLGNLRQIGVAACLYADENNNLYPDCNVWPNELYQYLFPNAAKAFNQLPFGTRTVLLCPAVKIGASNNGNGMISYGINTTDYQGRSRLRPEYAGTTNNISASKLIAFSDSIPTTANVFANSGIPVGRHPGGVNVVFADGHAECVSLPVGSAAWNNLFWGYQRE